MARRRSIYIPSAGGGGGGPVVPTLGSGTPTKNVGTGSSLTGDVQHTPAGAACIVRYIARSNSTATSSTVTATLGGIAVTFPALSQAGSAGATNRIFSGIGYVLGLTPGSPVSFILTWTNTLGDMIARIDDISNFSASNIGDVNADTYDSTAKNNHSLNLTMQGNLSLLLAAIGGTSGSLDPLTAGNSFTKQSEDVSGTSSTSDVCAGFLTKTGGSIGAVETPLITGSATATKWGGAALELKAA